MKCKPRNDRDVGRKRGKNGEMTGETRTFFSFASLVYGDFLAANMEEVEARRADSTTRGVNISGVKHAPNNVASLSVKASGDFGAFDAAVSSSINARVT